MFPGVPATQSIWLLRRFKSMKYKNLPGDLYNLVTDVTASIHLVSVGASYMRTCEPFSTFMMGCNNCICTVERLPYCSKNDCADGQENSFGEHMDYQMSDFETIKCII